MAFYRVSYQSNCSCLSIMLGLHDTGIFVVCQALQVWREWFRCTTHHRQSLSRRYMYTCTARCLIYYGKFNNMRFVLHGFRTAFLCPRGTVELYFSVPVELYTVFSDCKTLTKNPGQESGPKSSQILSKSGQNLTQN